MEIRDNITALSSKIVQEFEYLSTSVVSDAIDILELTSGGCLPYSIRPLYNYPKPLVGFITTVYAPDGARWHQFTYSSSHGNTCTRSSPTNLDRQS